MLFAISIDTRIAHLFCTLYQEEQQNTTWTLFLATQERVRSNDACLTNAVGMALLNATAAIKIYLSSSAFIAEVDLFSECAYTFFYHSEY